MPTNLYTEVTIDDRTFRIKKFDAKTGLKLARLVIAKAAPILPMIQDGNTSDARVFTAIGGILESLDDADLDNIIDKCLRVCYEDLPAGPAPVIDDLGHYGVENVEYDMMLTLRLCIEAIKWGASDFFDEKSSNLLQTIRAGSSPNP